MKQVKISNFGNIDELTVKPEKINVFVGPTGAGKSTALLAIMKGMTGSIDATEIKNGAKSASIAITLDNDVTVTRRRTPSALKCMIGNQPNSMKAVNAYIEEETQVSIKALEAMSGVPFFIGKTGKDIGALLYKILPLAKTPDEIVEISKDMLGDLLGDEETILRNAFEDAQSISDKELEKAYKSISAQRTDVNREIRRLKVLTTQTYTPCSRTEEDLMKRREEIANLEAQNAVFKERMAEYERAYRDWQRILAGYNQTKQALSTFSHVFQPDEAQFLSLKTQIEQTRKYRTQAVERKAHLEAGISNNEKSLRAMQTGVCPLHTEIVCQTDKTPVIEALQNANQLAQQNITQCEQYIAQCDQYLALAEQSVQTYNQNARFWEQKKALETNLAAYVVPQEPVKPQDVPVTDFSAEKAQISADLKNLAIIKNIEDSNKELAEKENILFSLERLVNLLDPKKGIRMEILKRVLTLFEDKCQAKAKVFRPGFSIKFACDEDGLDILIEPKAGSGFRSMTTASTGEFLFVCYMLMSVINLATATTSGFMILDGLDALDAETLGNFLAVIRDDAEVQHFFCATVNHQDTLDVLQSIGANIIPV